MSIWKLILSVISFLAVFNPLKGFFPKDKHAALNIWSANQGKLEDELYLYDFYRQEPGYDTASPLVYCLTGGLMAFVKIKGIDPEPFGSDTFEDASGAVRRALDNFSPESIEDEFRGGQWEIINYFVRSPGSPPALAKPAIESSSLEYLWQKTHAYWENKETFDDSIIFAIHFFPKYRSRNDLLKMRDPLYHATLIKEKTDRLAKFVRRVVKSFVEDLTAFQTNRPRMGFEPSMMNEDEVYKFLYMHVNKKYDVPTPLSLDDPLLTQVCFSIRNNTSEFYIGNEQAEVITFKRPPKSTIGNTFKTLLDNCRFPFTICQIFNTVTGDNLVKKTERDQGIAEALKGQSMSAARFSEEAKEFLGALQVDGATPFLWKFTAIVHGKPGAEFEDRSNKFKSYLKAVQGAEPITEEQKTRLVAELSTIPGNGFCNLRQIIATSQNGGDSAFVYRLQSGSGEGHLLFGDRQGGIYKFNLFEPSLPSWNCAVLGGPGSGKSLMMNLQIIALAQYPSQIYVIDIGNSFGTVFNFLELANPGKVSTMRVEGGDFAFNPLPLVRALQEREKQANDGTYREILSDGSQTPCPVEMAKQLFSGWIRVLVGQGRELTPEENNALDRALNGQDGDGFFTSYEHLCAEYLNAQEAGRTHIEPPKPLTQLKKFFRQSAPMLFEALEVWTRGDEGKYFDSGHDSITDAKALYLELSGLDRKPALVKPFIAALMSTIWQRVTNPALIHEKKIIVIDEAWAFLSDPAFSGVIEMMLRTIRKFNGFVVLSTQTPDDIKKGDNIKLLRTMSRQILYKGFSDDEYYRQHLLLDDYQIQLHGDIRSDDKVREAYIWDQNGGVRVVRVEVDPYRYWFVTSDALDKGFRAAFINQYGSIQAAVERLVEACEGRTIPSRSLRSKLITDYAQKHRFSISN